MTSHSGSISTQEIRELLPQQPIIFDVGANTGSHTRRFMLTSRQAVVHCFEPEPRTWPALFKIMQMPAGSAVKRGRSYMTENKDGGRVWLHAVAVGRKDGTVLFHQSDGEDKEWLDSGSIKTPTAHLTEHPWVKFDRTIEVSVVSLDSWDTKFRVPRVDYMHIDVQGAEGDVFAGGREVLAKTRYVYAEFNVGSVPLYEGALSLDQTLSALGAQWEAVAIYERCNVLCRNKAAI
jgi:FkbM family methyltransferase